MEEKASFNSCKIPKIPRNKANTSTVYVKSSLKHYLEMPKISVAGQAYCVLQWDDLTSEKDQASHTNLHNASSNQNAIGFLLELDNLILRYVQKN